MVKEKVAEKPVYMGKVSAPLQTLSVTPSQNISFIMEQSMISRSRMRETCKSGSVGVEGEWSPSSTRYYFPEIPELSSYKVPGTVVM